jgi:hypothetical protein
VRHFPDGVETFEKTSIDGETRGEWYVRQMLGAANIDGGPLLHLMTGNLSFQVEHHLYPDLPSNRYKEIAPKVQELFERHGLTYAPARCRAARLGVEEGRAAVAAERRVPARTQGRGPRRVGAAAAGPDRLGRRCLTRRGSSLELYPVGPRCGRAGGVPSFGGFHQGVVHLASSHVRVLAPRTGRACPATDVNAPRGTRLLRLASSGGWRVPTLSPAPAAPWRVRSRVCPAHVADASQVRATAAQTTRRNVLRQSRSHPDP